MTASKTVPAGVSPGRAEASASPESAVRLTGIGSHVAPPPSQRLMPTTAPWL
jgi:hypothetical protein